MVSNTEKHILAKLMTQLAKATDERHPKRRSKDTIKSPNKRLIPLIKLNLNIKRRRLQLGRF